MFMAAGAGITVATEAGEVGDATAEVGDPTAAAGDLTVAILEARGVATGTGAVVEVMVAGAVVAATADGAVVVATAAGAVAMPGITAVGRTAAAGVRTPAMRLP